MARRDRSPSSRTVCLRGSALRFTLALAFLPIACGEVRLNVQDRSAVDARRAPVPKDAGAEQSVDSSLGGVDGDAIDSTEPRGDATAHSLTDGRFTARDSAAASDQSTHHDVTTTDDALADAQPPPDAGGMGRCPAGLRPILEGDFSGDWIKRFGKGQFRPGFAGGSWTEQIEHEGQTCLRLHMKAGRAGSDNGMFFKSPVEPGDHYATEMTFRLKPGFVYNHTGKLIGGMNGYLGERTPPGVKPTGRDKFSARSTWNSKGQAMAYVYHPEQTMWGGYGDTFPVGAIPAGTLHRIREELVLNSPGKHDGKLRYWLNGKLVLERVDMRFRDIPELKIIRVSLESFFGGSAPTHGPKRDEWIDYCSLRICGP